MFFMFDHCWKGCKSFISICCLHDFFPCTFHVILALDEVMVERISLGVCRSFVNGISVPFKYLMKNCWLKTFSDWDTFVQFVLVMHRSSITCCDTCFSKRIWKHLFLTIIYAQQNLKWCMTWVLQSKSADWGRCCAKYVIIKFTT